MQSIPTIIILSLFAANAAATWEAVCEGEVIAISKGKIAARALPGIAN